MELGAQGDRDGLGGLLSGGREVRAAHARLAGARRRRVRDARGSGVLRRARRHDPRRRGAQAAGARPDLAVGGALPGQERRHDRARGLLRHRAARSGSRRLPPDLPSGHPGELHDAGPGPGARPPRLPHVRLARSRHRRRLGLPVQRGRVHGGGRVRPPDAGPVRVLAGAPPAAHVRRARAHARPRAADRPRRDPVGGALLHEAGIAGRAGHAEGDGGGRRGGQGVVPGDGRGGAHDGEHARASPASPAARPRRPTTSSATPCAARAA